MPASVAPAEPATPPDTPSLAAPSTGEPSSLALVPADPSSAQAAEDVGDAAAAPEPTKRSLSCNRLDSLRDMHAVLQEQGHDFWLSCLAEGAHISFSKSLEKMMCDGIPAAEAFTHCYVTRASDIKAETNALIDQYGLGLRRKRVHAKSGPGYILLLVNQETFSALSKRNSLRKGTDKRLSTEERLRRTTMRFVEVDGKGLLRMAKKHQLSYWLTTYSKVGPTECKHRIVAAKMDKQFATERFALCFIYETNNLYRVCQRIVAIYGMGLRRHKIHSKAESGCVVLLVSTKEAIERPVAAKEITKIKLKKEEKKKKKKKKKKHKQAKEEKKEEPEWKTADISSLAPPPDPDLEGDVAADADVAEMEMLMRSRAEAEVKRVKQLRFLERRLAMLFPPLIGQQLTPVQLQAMLEKAINKPPGRLTPFRREIAQMWENLIEADKHQRQLRVLERRLDVVLPMLHPRKLNTEVVQAKLEESMQRPAGRFDKFRSDIEAYWRGWADAKGIPVEPLPGEAHPLRDALAAEREAEAKRLGLAPVPSTPPSPPLADGVASGAGGTRRLAGLGGPGGVVHVVLDDEDSGSDGLEILGVAPAPGAGGGPLSRPAALRASGAAAAAMDDGLPRAGGFTKSPAIRVDSSAVSDQLSSFRAPAGDSAPPSHPSCASVEQSESESEYSESDAEQPSGSDGEGDGDDEGSDMEVDEFGLTLALSQLEGPCSVDVPEKEAALRLLLRSTPSQEALAEVSWQPLLDAIASAPSSGELGVLARCVADRWSAMTTSCGVAAAVGAADVGSVDVGTADVRAADAGATEVGVVGAVIAGSVATAPGGDSGSGSVAAICTISAVGPSGGGGRAVGEAVPSLPPMDQRRKRRRIVEPATTATAPLRSATYVAQAPMQAMYDSAYAALAMLQARAAAAASATAAAAAAAGGVWRTGHSAPRAMPTTPVFIEDDEDEDDAGEAKLCDDAATAGEAGVGGGTGSAAEGGGDAGDAAMGGEGDASDAVDDSDEFGHAAMGAILCAGDVSDGVTGGGDVGDADECGLDGIGGGDVGTSVGHAGDGNAGADGDGGEAADTPMSGDLAGGRGDGDDSAMCGGGDAEDTPGGGGDVSDATLHDVVDAGGAAGGGSDAGDVDDAATCGGGESRDGGADDSDTGDVGGGAVGDVADGRCDAFDASVSDSQGRRDASAGDGNQSGPHTDGAAAI